MTERDWEAATRARLEKAVPFARSADQIENEIRWTRVESGALRAKGTTVQVEKIAEGCWRVAEYSDGRMTTLWDEISTRREAKRAAVGAIRRHLAAARTK